MAKTFGGQSIVLISVKLLLLACLGLIATNVHAAESSLELQGTTQELYSLPDNLQTGLDITGDMSVSMWVKPANISENDALLSKWNNNVKTQYILFLENGDLGVHLNDEASGSGYSTHRAAHGKSAGAWFQVGMVYRAASGTTELFVNGQSIGVSATAPNSISNTDADFVIGGREDREAPFQGKIDEVKIWSRALTNAQMLAQGTAPLTVKNGKNIQGYWKLNGNLKDRTANQNHLLSPRYSNDVPF